MSSLNKDSPRIRVGDLFGDLFVGLIILSLSDFKRPDAETCLIGVVTSGVIPPEL